MRRGLQRLEAPWHEVLDAGFRMAVEDGAERGGDVVDRVRCRPSCRWRPARRASPSLGAALVAGKQRVLAGERNLPVILPMSGRKSSSITVASSVRASFPRRSEQRRSPGGSCNRSGAWRRHCCGGVDARSGRLRGHGDRPAARVGGRALRSASTSAATRSIGEAPRTTPSSRRSTMTNPKTDRRPPGRRRQLLHGAGFREAARHEPDPSARSVVPTGEPAARSRRRSDGGA